mmetsp:Transcript_22558/g.32974  ORF Transcript_22558/g.32974 Transcript_22558/m.32974 type:complete len:300 (-) Transcript_22558:390-1289(-)
MEGSTLPCRVSVMTFNIWGNNFFPERIPVLRNTVSTIAPDIAVFQEVTPDNLKIICDALPYHTHINSWELESNILWDERIIDKIEHGFQSLHIADYPRRGLFWARFRLRSRPDISFIVSTAHFPWCGTETEITTGINPRIECARRVLEYLSSIMENPLEPVVFAGDFNEDFHPLRVLRLGNRSPLMTGTATHSLPTLALHDVFESLHLMPPVTHPIRPSSIEEENRPSRTIDYITTNAPLLAHIQSVKDSKLCTNLSDEIEVSNRWERFRVVAAFVNNSRGGWPPASDHMAVVAVLQLQ